VQELLGRISALDPQASLGLRIIACYDELIVGNVNTRGLLSAAASLAGCNAGYCQELPPRSLRVTPRGDIAGPDREPAVPRGDSMISADGLTVWIERDGEPLANDAMILERLALAVRIRHGRGRRDADARRDLSLLLDQAVPADDRRVAAARLNLLPGTRYRVIAAPLFAVWDEHPVGAEDVIATPHGPIHALVVPHDQPPVPASPIGTGPAAGIDHLHRSFRTAVAALRLCNPPAVPSVLADDYGGLVGLLADLPQDSELPDADSLDAVMSRPWGSATIDALVRTSSIRQAARQANIHHSTMQTRLENIVAELGYDPLDDGIGRTRLGLAYLVWRLRNSRVLDLPAPTHAPPAPAR
jgi:PucR C-terminal helix-turn-helix domain